MRKLKCILGLHKYEYFRKVFTVTGISYLDSIMLRRRKCTECGKYQGKSAWLRDEWKDCDVNEGNTLVPLSS